ncbi:FeoC-like transcriptional regulator [Spirochaeta cellobiosiphila]|uniref:FeoC-like transcriptional regulator n=1 Tax=Spirochaeta cellobiosiphila TaxID=504483 RepID=UPI000402D642|nr:FeoC-like transcriptional regulator [Spirochaeta cellobiosiphila]
MLVKEVRSFLRDHKEASLLQIVGMLKEDKEMVRLSLHLLQQRHLVEEYKVPLPCKSCNCGSSCDEKDSVYYKWVG